MKKGMKEENEQDTKEREEGVKDVAGLTTKRILLFHFFHKFPVFKQTKIMKTHNCPFIYRITRKIIIEGTFLGRDTEEEGVKG